jgi:ADP-ribosyl-[dinitrogen reductase] hydrolase
MDINYLDKFRGSLLGVAIGDTLGHPFEGVLREIIQSKFNNFEEYINNNKRLFNTYTDDTQLTIHTAKALIEGEGFKLNYLINEYINWLDDPPIGAGYGCITAAQKMKYGISWKESASNSGGNGTTMRIAPIGLLFCKDLDKLKEVAIQSSLLTHSHPAATAGALIIARAIAYLIDKNPEEGFSIDDFFNSIISSISGSQDKIWMEFLDLLEKLRLNLHLSIEAGLIKFSQAGVKSPYFIEPYLGKAFIHPYTISTVICVLFIFLKKLGTFKECIYELTTAGGDTDTAGAIGGSLAGAYFGMENVSESLIHLVKGHKKILKISDQLYEIFKKNY